MNSREFGQRVYRLRMKKKWTQAICADRAGISIRNIRMIESYQASPTLATVQELATTFRCTWEDLLGPAVKMPPSAAKK
jgi:transcriptional regulator with XRE-family HTH domain